MENAVTTLSDKSRFPEEPAEGSRQTVDHELTRTRNHRESGARKLQERPGENLPDPIYTGDRGDEPPGSTRGEDPTEPTEENNG